MENKDIVLEENKEERRQSQKFYRDDLDKDLAEGNL